MRARRRRWFLITQYRIALPLTIVHQQFSSDLIGLLTAGNSALVIVVVMLIGKRVERRGTVGRLDVFALSTAVLGGGWLLCAVEGVGPLVAAVIVTSVGESLFCGVVDAVVAGLAAPGRIGLYLGYSTMAWGVGGMLGGLVGSGFDLAADHGGCCSSGSSSQRSASRPPRGRVRRAGTLRMPLGVFEPRLAAA
ncbi:MFS transporter [Streptomyces stramineus]